MAHVEKKIPPWIFFNNEFQISRSPRCVFKESYYGKQTDFE